MPYKMNEKQFEAVLALSSFDRYVHFVGKAADWQQLWGARNDEGWFLRMAPRDLEYFPVWPHPEYAQRIMDETFPGHTATEITLQSFMTHWLPLFQRDDVRVGVFPNMDWTLWLIEAKDLEEVLTEELETYE